MTDETKAPAPLAFIDVETTSLDPTLGEVWEVAAVIRPGDRPTFKGMTKHRWLLPASLQGADPIALNVGGFHQRHPRGNAFDIETVADIVEAGQPYPTHLHDFAREFARLTHGCHLVGAVVSFDEKRLERLLRSQNVMPSWHYHLIDVEALAVGWLSRGAGYKVAEPPWKSDQITEAIGVKMPSKDERHTALGDALWAMRLYDKVMGGAG